MGREKGYKLSPERIKRMQMAKERKKLGYTRHLSVVGEMIPKKLNALFEKWHIDIEVFLFLVDGCDYRFDPITELRKKNVKWDYVASIAIRLLESKKVSEVEVVCDDERVLKLTANRGNVLFVRKKGAEYFVEDFYDWEPNAFGDLVSSNK